MLYLRHLPNKLPNENIVKVVRRDLFILVQKVFLIFLLVVLPLVFFYLFVYSNQAFVSSPFGYALSALALSIYYLFVWLFAFFSFIDYYLDIWVITSERIVDVEQRGFFSRVISEHKLSRIQDVTSEVHGFWATIFRYGDVYIQTAGAKQRFKFHEIPAPNRIRDLIIKLVQEKKKEAAADGKQEVKDGLL